MFGVSSRDLMYCSSLHWLGMHSCTMRWAQSTNQSSRRLYPCVNSPQAGTPRVTVSTEYDAAAKTLTLRAKQTVPGTAGQPAETKVRVSAAASPAPGAAA